MADDYHRPHSWRGIPTSLHPADSGCVVCDHEDLHDIRQLLSSWESKSDLFQSFSGRACSSPALGTCKIAPVGKSDTAERIRPLLPPIDIDNELCITSEHHVFKQVLSTEIVGEN